MTTVYCTEGGRLDCILADETELTRSHIKRLVDGGRVFVDGVSATKAGQQIKVGSAISFEDEVDSCEIIPRDIPLDIIYEDDEIIVLNKQRNLVVHPGAGNRDNTLVNALKYKYGDNLSTSGGEARAGIVHRLDKDTTGLMVVAKTNFAHGQLCAQFSERRIGKFYRAICDGNFKSSSGVIDAAIGRDRHNRLKMAVDSGGRAAVTGYKVLERFNNNCYCEFELFTGRTHQIRVHCAYVHHAVSCDPLYGGSTKLNCDGQLLHSYKLEFDHPRSNERLVFTAEEPSDFLSALNKLRNTEKTEK
ncbi:MAG: RluA family pseudouridine synthase [Clostridiales bacterium]|nr:RluA family pseudouridine synthase [Clostridiales bacterium]